MIIKARQVRLVSFIIAFILATPLSKGVVSGFYIWTSPLLLLNNILSGHWHNALHFTAIGILILIILYPRWYCKWMCPAGVLCDTASQYSKSKVRSNRFPTIYNILLYATLVTALFGTPILAILDPLNLFHAFFDVFSRQSVNRAMLKSAGLIIIVMINFAVPHIWCQKLCPLGGLQNVATSFRRLFKKRVNIASSIDSRRLVLGTLVGFGLGLALRRTTASSQMLLRPPGALREEELKCVCWRCGNCSKACPTGIIRSSFDSNDLLGLLTPHISFTTSYCVPECTACGTVCPSGAIHKFSKKDKKELPIGLARVRIKDCLLTKRKECDLCRIYCEYDAVDIKLDGLVAFPHILTEKCVGCGACQLICPEHVIEIIPKSEI